VRIWPALVTAALLPAVAGCGGHDSNTSASRTGAAARLTQAQYVAQATALCKRTSRNTPAFPGKRSGKGLQTTAADVLPYLEEVHSLTVNKLRAFQELQPPAAKAAAVKRLLAAEKARLLDLEAAQTAAQGGDGKAFTAAIQKDQRKDRPAYVRAALALGLEACAAGA
jgi:hypothetical protein